MENEIKKLIEKYNKEYNEVPPFSAIPTWIIIRDLQSLLEFKKKNCCGKSQDESLIIAFVQGAQWWEYHKTTFTMWQTDTFIAEEEAARRLKGDTLGKTVMEIINENAKDKTK